VLLVLGAVVEDRLVAVEAENHGQRDGVDGSHFGQAMEPWYRFDVWLGGKQV
jgi:hypothetical protein